MVAVNLSFLVEGPLCDECGSYGLLNEMVNLVVNEKQIVPDNQCNTPARKQMN